VPSSAVPKEERNGPCIASRLPGIDKACRFGVLPGGLVFHRSSPRTGGTNPRPLWFLSCRHGSACLEVPINDLLLDCEAPLSAPVLTRARAIEGDENCASNQEANKCLFDRSHDFNARTAMIEVMPELRDVAPWHSVGQRRFAMTSLGGRPSGRCPTIFSPTLRASGKLSAGLRRIETHQGTA